MSLTITAHGPHEPIVSLLGSGAGAFASLSTDGVGILIHTVAEADALIKAAVAAKDLLLAAKACGDIAEHTKLPCELQPGHEGWHRAGQIVWPREGDGDDPESSVDAMIATLDAQPDLSDGIDPRTWREVYDAGLVSEADVAHAYGQLPAIPEPLPAGHGENHHDNAGHATHVTSGLRVAGCVTCEAGHAEPHFDHHPVTGEDFCQCPCADCHGHVPGLEIYDCLCEPCACHADMDVTA